jgi:DNA-directed RNA polymerase specialized sigma24 family protein
VPKVEHKKDWTLTPGAFQRLLNWLDATADSGGEMYLEMRRRLADYFDRKNCTSPDELADETLNRVARRLEEEGTIVSDAPAHYCYIVARFVFLESLRQEQPQESAETNDFRLAAPPETAEEKQEDERRWECLEHCMAKIDADSRQLIINYYHGEQREKIDNRRAMAEQLGITLNALSIRSCRIRAILEDCIRKCLTRNP